jgi:hypothetical protein
MEQVIFVKTDRSMTNDEPLTNSHKIVSLENLIVAHLVKKLPFFMETEGFLNHSNRPI